VKHSHNSVDGFIPRRPQRSSLDNSVKTQSADVVGRARPSHHATSELHTGRKQEISEITSAAPNKLQDNISQSLQAIDGEQQQEKQIHKKRRQKRRWVKIALWVFGALVAVGIGFLLWRAWNMVSQVFNGNILGILQQQELKMDAQGRSNVLVVGTTDDDPTRKAEGDGILTDSMMVISVDQKKKDAYMFSIPRDLWVKYGTACSAGYEGKINVMFGCIADGDTEEAEKARLEGIRTFVGDILDMDIQYTVHVKSNVVRDAVNAVGGVTVNVESRDERGVLDASLDWMCTQDNPTAEEQQRRCPTGHYIDFPNGPNEMDGDKAMWFSRARGVGYGETYGLEQSNFDREKNQQLVLMALKSKAMSTGTLTDFGKITKLMDAMGDNLRSDVESAEIRTIMSIASEMSDENIHRLDLYSEENPLMTTGMVGAQSIVQPTAGLYDYSAIRAYIRKTVYASALSREAAQVIVVNAGGYVGAAGKETERLAELGMNMLDATNADEDISGKYVVYQLAADGEKPETRQKLAELYGVSIQHGTPPFAVPEGVDFVVLIGPEATE